MNATEQLHDMKGEPEPNEWAVAKIATSLADGTPTHDVPAGELEDAARGIVGALRAAGQDRTLMSTGVWDLAALAEGESIEFPRKAVAQLLDRLRVRIVWDRNSWRAMIGSWCRSSVERWLECQRNSTILRGLSPGGRSNQGGVRR